MYTYFRAIYNDSSNSNTFLIKQDSSGKSHWISFHARSISTAVYDFNNSNYTILCEATMEEARYFDECHRKGTYSAPPAGVIDSTNKFIPIILVVKPDVVINDYPIC